ncbi:MAG TPA: thioredoxin [Haloplasmataceae bacterium]
MAVHVTDATFEEEIKVGKTLVDFWAPWCGPCRMLGPVIEELAQEFEGKIKIAKLNVDENPITASRFGVMSIPTMIYFEDGKPIEQIVGFYPKPVLKEYLESKLK